MKNLKFSFILLIQKILKHSFRFSIPLNNSSDSNIIEFYRRESGLTQQLLADEFGVTQSAVNHAIFRDKNSTLRANVIATINNKILATQ